MNGKVAPVSCPFSDSDNLTNGNGKSAKPQLKLKVPQPIRLRYLIEEEEQFDTLHEDPGTNLQCNEKVCCASIMGIPGRGDVPRTAEETYEEAQLFLKQYFASIKREDSETHRTRLEEIKKELDQTGTYHLKSSELVFGAKLAWRNASRCIGRIQWKKLQIFDCREVTTASGMFEAICTHIKYATNKGNIRSAITIFPQRTDGKHDYRIWNPQLISYAGYIEEDGTPLGDPGKAEFTDVCMKLGWKPPSPRTPWDILPLVLSANGKDPEVFDLPREIIMEIDLEHPNYDWFKDLGLRWYVLPAVSNMRMDCGGLEFTATAFNGWYMSTEIGCRNLCDVTRLNITERVALKLGLDTSSPVSLWKDKAVVEVNIAVLHSFLKNNVSIVDHHSASEQFLKHLDTENKTRGGCPSDWIWIVPPLSSSLTGVFHQEMLLYYLKPSYDYQEPAWKTYHWKKAEGGKLPHRKFHFKQIARAVKFTSKLFGRALSKRIKATILYATETGKSEQYAKELGNIFGHAFNAQVHCMADYDMFSIEHETLLLIVSSTFGNGEPPANGETFAEHLFQMLYHDKSSYSDQSGESALSHKIATPKTLMRTNSIMSPRIEYKRQLTRLESNKSNTTVTSNPEHMGPLSNVSFAVFALGSSAYPKFCNFGKTVDKILYDLGADRVLDLACGDEMYGQEQAFRSWSSNVFDAACEMFCIEENDTVKDAQNALSEVPLTEDTVRFGRVSNPIPLKCALETSFRKHVVTCKVKESKPLGDVTADRATAFVDMEPDTELKYEPGDHVGVMPCNRKEIVEAVLERCKDVDSFDKTVQLQVMKETLTPMGSQKTWEKHERLAPVTIRQIFTRFLDITTPPSTKLLKYLAKICSDENEATVIRELISDSNKFDDWRHFYYPNLAEVLQQFPSCNPQASLLAALLPPLQPRFYSISSSPLAHHSRIHVTVAVVTFRTQNGKGPTHHGVCSTYLQNLKQGDEVMVFIRRAPSFHMPKDITAPLILVGPGSGIAPFRGFWHQRRCQIKDLSPKMKDPGPVWLFFGCRTRGMDLYKNEKQQALKDGILTKTFCALSREKDVEKKHVQTVLEEQGAEVTKLLLEEGGHLYVCGDCKMAEEVQQTLKGIIQHHANMTDEEVENCILDLMDENRYHEDIFGITLRTAEVHSASREFAKKTRAESLTLS
ncbi:hypothetical protein O0L34_g6909 [Tuta absoluta]|nr:hypothetical protein O0L34_g6909 [Tuta absoluta]